MDPIIEALVDRASRSGHASTDEYVRQTSIHLKELRQLVQVTGYRYDDKESAQNVVQSIEGLMDSLGEYAKIRSKDR